MGATLEDAVSGSPKYKGITIDGLPIERTKSVFKVISSKMFKHLNWLNVDLFSDLYPAWASSHVLHSSVDRLLTAPARNMVIYGGPLYPFVRMDSTIEASKVEEAFSDRSILNVVILPKNPMWCHKDLKDVFGTSVLWDDVEEFIETYMEKAQKYRARFGLHVIEEDFALPACKKVLGKVFEED